MFFCKNGLRQEKKADKTRTYCLSTLKAATKVETVLNQH